MVNPYSRNRKFTMAYKIKPVWIKADEVQALTIWTNRDKMKRARLAGNLRIVRRENQIFYNLNEIDNRFLKTKQTT